LENAVKHEYAVKLAQFETDLRMRTQIDMAKLNSHLTMELEIAKTKIGPLSERQFDLYNALWGSLCDLKYAMSLLWDTASEERFNTFSKKLEETTMTVEKAGLIVEETHYNDLMTILNEFWAYQMGKVALRDYRNGGALYDAGLAQKMIEDSKATKQKLIGYLPRMKESLRRQITGRSIVDRIKTGEIAQCTQNQTVDTSIL
jgi:hypothetical protein